MKEKALEPEGDDELRAEYPADLIRSGVRGKYASQRAKSHDGPFDLAEAIAVLERTPAVLDALLRDLPTAWTDADEGPDTWSPHAVVGHLIHGERTDWIARARIILEAGGSRAFEPFDRFAQFAGPRRPLSELLDTFAALRADNLETVRGWDLVENDLAKRGLHPELGSCTLAELLATWTAHDLNHVVQVARVMAKRYTTAVGPWRAYLGVLR